MAKTPKTLTPLQQEQVGDYCVMKFKTHVVRASIAARIGAVAYLTSLNFNLYPTKAVMVYVQKHLRKQILLGEI